MEEVELGNMNKDRVTAKIRSDIATFGWHCLSVHPRQGELGSYFTYTIGLTETLNHPEIMIFGLGSKTAHSILSDCVTMIRQGTSFQPNVEYSNVIGGGYKVVFKQVRSEVLPEYFGTAVRYYKGRGLSGLIMFWPDKEHRFPWQEVNSTAQNEALTLVEQ